MKYVIRYIKNNKELFLIILLGLIPLLWFKGSLIAGGDTFIPANPISQLINSLFTWNQQDLGTMNTGGTNLLFPYLSFWSIFKLIGMPIQVIEILWLICLFVLPGISMYYLILAIRKHLNRIFALISSISYMFSPYVLMKYVPPQFPLLLSLGIIPLLLALFIKGSSLKTDNWGNTFLIGLVSLFSLYIGVNPPTYAVLWIPIIIWILYSFIISKEKKRVFSFAIKSLLIILLFNLFWIIPYLQIIYQPTFVAAHSDISQVNSADINANLENLFRLLGDWTWNQGAFGSLYYPYETSYNNPFLIILTFLMPIMSCFGLIFWKRNKFILFFAILGIIGLFFAKGINPPLGSIYTYFYEHVPFFWIFRESYSHFAPLIALSFCILFGYSSDNTYMWFLAKTRISQFKIKRMLSVCFSVVIIVIILVNGWPIITGDLIPGDRGNLPGMRTEIPQYWLDFSEYSNSLHSDGRILLLPQNPFYQMHYFWPDDGYYGVDPTSHMTSKTLISITPGGGYIKSPDSENMIKLFYNEIKKGDPETVSKFIQILNIQYILQRNDLDWTHMGTQDTGSPQEMYKIINKLPVQSEKSFGKISHEQLTTDQYFQQVIVNKYPYIVDQNALDLYRVSDEILLPKIYTVSDVIAVNGDLNNVLDIISSNSFIPGKSAIFVSNQLDSSQRKFIEQNRLALRTIKDNIIPVYSTPDKEYIWSNPNNNVFEARYYDGWKPVIKTDGSRQQDTLSFTSVNDVPFQFPSYSSDGWSSFNSTLIYIKAGVQGLTLDDIQENGESLSDITGVWWETGWMGMDTKALTYPITIPPNQKAIIQVNHQTSNVDLIESSFVNRQINQTENDNLPIIKFKQVDPTKYTVRIENAVQPFYIIFPESYNRQWKAYLNTHGFTNWFQALYQSSIPDERHLEVNGYANAWYIDPSELASGQDFNVTLYYKPQSQFILGCIISGLTLVVCLGVLVLYLVRKRKTRLSLN